jgi:hypothetical protein
MSTNQDEFAKILTETKVNPIPEPSDEELDSFDYSKLPIVDTEWVMSLDFMTAVDSKGKPSEGEGTKPSFNLSVLADQGINSPIIARSEKLVSGVPDCQTVFRCV